jgi:DNA-binding response OmpR family regulator
MATLLYVDDEETIGRAVARWFERRGHLVHVARTLDAARRVLLEHEPDIIFIDVWLGADSGFELLGWIEDVKPQLADRVVFVTGELSDAQLGRGQIWKRLGRPVLQKPFDFSQLEAYTRRPGDAKLRTGT